MDYNIFLRHLRGPTLTRIIIFLSIMGPGIITASVDNDAGGITTYSLAGSQFGYVLLWTFIPITIALAIIQEMGVRMGVVTGKGLASLIRERAGVRITFSLMFALLLTNFGNTLAEFSGIAVSAGIFGVPRLLALPLAAVFVWGLVVKGSYRSVEKIFLAASLLYVSYILAGLLAHPDWNQAALHVAVPQISFNQVYLAMLIGLVGTTIAPWMQFYIQASIVEKGVPVKDLIYSRIDAFTGAIIVNVVAFFIVVLCAATIFTNGVQVNNVADVSAALLPLAGQYAGVLFAFGLLNASLFAASILPLSTAYVVSEGLGLEAGVSKSFSEAPVFHGLYVGIIAVGALIIMIPNAPLLTILYVSQIINGILLPIVLIFMLVIVNDKRVMGDHVNSKIYNYITWTTVVIMIGLSVGLIVTTFL
ncbi:MAG: NRAMP family divalent metal transporter [Halobacteriota archaeon]